MFPNEHAVYFNCSRNMLDGAIEKRNEYYDAYVKSCIKTSIDKCVFIDIHGTGKRCFGYFELVYNDVPFNFLLSSSYRKYDEFPDITKKYHALGKFINLVFDARGSPIEMLNYDVQGTLQNFDANGEIRDKAEYGIIHLESYHVCVKYICKLIKEFDVTNIDSINLDNLYRVIRKIYRVIQDNKPAISVYIKHPAKHPKNLDVN